MKHNTEKFPNRTVTQAKPPDLPEVHLCTIQGIAASQTTPNLNGFKHYTISRI